MATEPPIHRGNPALCVRFERDPEVRSLLAALREATGIRLRIAPLSNPSHQELEQIVGDHPFCEEFVRSEDARKKCLELYASLRAESIASAAPVRKSCAAGLTHIALPLIVQSKAVALLEFVELKEGTAPRKGTVGKLKRLIREKFNHSTAAAAQASASKLFKRHSEQEIEGVFSLLKVVLPLLETRISCLEQPNTAALPAALYRAMEYARANFGFPEKTTLVAVAREVRRCPRSLRQLFRDHLDTTFKEWVTHIRITQAAKLLRESNLPVSEIAFSCGFAAVNTFHRAFKAHQGTTPCKYRDGTA